MTGDRRDEASFARAVDALAPYLGQLVFIGGWAHHLFTLRPEAGPVPFEPLRTDDADIAVRGEIRPNTKTIVQCLADADFKERLWSEHVPPISEFILGDEMGGFCLEFLAPLIGGEVKRDGRRNVTTMVAGATAQKLRHLDILFIAPWQVTLTEQNGFPVVQPRVISVPNPVTYIVQKMLVLPKRTPDKQAKDLLYVHDTFALFADSLTSLRELWGTLRETMRASHVRTFEKRVHSNVGEVNNLVRRAVLIARERPMPPSPDVLLLGLRRGFASAFELR